jgi:NTF2 fold immunity protein
VCWGIIKVEVTPIKLHRAICCAALLLAVAQAQSYAPKDGFVPDPKTAVKIAEAVLIPVYGEKQIESERPFKAVLENGVWTVSGTLHCHDGKGGVTTVCVGGTAEVKLSKTDGRILKMIHYK